MTEENKETTTTQVVNNELTERVNSAYIANNYTLLNGGTDNVVMISGDKDGASVDILMTFDGLEQVVNSLRDEIRPKDEPAKVEESNEL